MEPEAGVLVPVVGRVGGSGSRGRAVGWCCCSSGGCRERAAKGPEEAEEVDTMPAGPQGRVLSVRGC